MWECSEGAQRSGGGKIRTSTNISGKTGKHWTDKDAGGNGKRIWIVFRASATEENIFGQEKKRYQ